MDIIAEVEGIGKAADNAIPVGSEDYIGADGLWYCGKCGTPKQTKVTILGREMKPMCLCACGIAERDKREAAVREAERLKAISRNRLDGFPDAQMQKWTFDKDDGQTAEIATAKEYADDFGNRRAAGKGIMFYGSVGVGKTFLAACIANALIDSGWTCLVTNCSRLEGQMHSGDRETVLDGLARYDLVVLDDLGAERNTEYMNQTVMDIIDARYRQRLPLIVTTNLTAKEIKNPPDLWRQRIYSRLLEMCDPVEVKGEDRRRKKIREEYERHKKAVGETVKGEEEDAEVR